MYQGVRNLSFPKNIAYLNRCSLAKTDENFIISFGEPAATWNAMCHGMKLAPQHFLIHSNLHQGSGEDTKLRYQ